MTYTMKPLPSDPATLTGLSERLILSHYENNYRGAVHMDYGAKAAALSMPSCRTSIGTT